MRKLATAAFSFSAAIFLSRYALPYDWLLVCCAIIAVVSIAGLFLRGHARIRAIIILIALAVGFLWSYIYTAAFIKPAWLLDGDYFTVSAVVTGYPSPHTRGYRADVVIRQDTGPPVGARLYYYKETALEPGDIVEFHARFRRTDGVGDGERFDALSSRGVFLAAYVSGNIEVTGSASRIKYLPLRLAEAVADMAVHIFPGDISPLIRALIIGKQDHLNREPELSAVLSAAGIMHIVAISGMHVVFLIGFFGAVVRNRRLLAYVGIPVLFLFMAMTGFTPSVSRAVIMQVFLLSAPLFKRESDGITSLSASLLVLLIANPYSCASAGLQLSFSATLGIILFTDRINSGVSDYLRSKKVTRRKPVKAAITFITSSLATTIGALVFTLPLTIIHFGYVSLIAPITNLLALWAVAFAFPFGLASCILGFISGTIGAVAAYPATLAARYIIAVSRTLASIPYSVVYASNALVMFWLAFVYIMFTTLPALRARARQYLYPACITIILLIAVILISPLTPGARETSVTVLDVGQGLSVAITSGRHSALVDCGSISGEYAGAIAHEFFLNEGRVVIDLLVLTHFHEDHTNGAEFFLSRVKVGALAIPDPQGYYLSEGIISLARKRGTDIIYVTEAMRLTLGELTVMLYPPVGYGDENERGLSVLTLGPVCALITGDMNASAERSLLRYVELPRLDMLVVGHHGSKNSTSEELLGAVRPDIAAISVGYNSFGHPARETLDRLDLFNTAVYRTDETGHVAVRGR